MSAIPDNASVAVSRHLILKYPALKLEICWTCTQVYNTPVTVKEAAKLSGHSHTVDTRK
jgi:hypothetical protein